MSALDHLRQIHSEMAALTERFGRELAQIESKAAERLARAGLPAEVEYDRGQLSGPPKPIPTCDCGERAVYKEGKTATGREWAAYFCARKPSDPNNCGFKQWVK